MSLRDHFAGRAVAATLLTAACALVAVQAHADAATGDTSPTSSSVAPMPDGGYVTTFSYANGDSMKVYAGTPVSLSGETTTSDPTTVSGSAATLHSASMSVTPTTTAKPTKLGSTTTAYDELIAMGVSATDAAPYKDMDNADGATAATRTPITKPLCITKSYDGGHLHLHGCDSTYKVGGSGAVWYLEDKTLSTATMHDTGCVFCDHLTGLKFGVKYGSGNQINNWKPADMYPVGSCVQNTVSLSYKGIGVSSTSTQCPAQFGLYGIGDTYFSTKWDGEGNGPNNGARATHAVDSVYDGASASPYPGVYWQVWYTTT